MSDDTVFDDTVTNERAARISAAADEVKASGGSARRAGRDPINLPMIRNWTEAIGDTNPIYESEEAAFGTEPWTLYAWRPAGTAPIDRQMPEVKEGGGK